MQKVTVSGFVKPYAQESLNGELGLTSLEIAQALGARHEQVKHRMQSLKSSDEAFTEVAVKVHGNGRPLELLVMLVTEAKLVVAKYDIEIGNEYLRLLVACEKVASEITPRLVAELKAARGELEKDQAELESTRKTLDRFFRG